MPSTKTVVTVSAVTAVTALVAYAAYFDYKRRNDRTFRKKLQKERKKVEKSKPKVAVPGSGHSAEEVKAALEVIKAETLPSSVEEKEQYFMDNVGTGEQLCTRGPAFYLPAALAFFRALRVYPSPVELIMIYQKTVPEPVFNLIMEMTSMDVSDTPGSAPAEPEATAPPAAPAPVNATAGSGDEDDGHVSDHSSPGKAESGPPSETSSLEWDNVTDPGVASGTGSPPQRPVYGPPLPP